MKVDKIVAVWLVTMILMVGGYFTITNIRGEAGLHIDNAVGGQVPEPSSSPVIVQIKDITAGMAGSRVRIAGSVTKIINHKDGHKFLLVADSSGIIDVPVFTNTGIDSVQFEAGKSYYFTGKVNEYGGKLEIVPQTPNDIMAARMEINDNVFVTTENTGKSVTVEGHVVKKYDHPDGHAFLTIRLAETNKEISVPIFKTMRYEASDFLLDSFVRIQGRVNIYNNALQVIPKDEGGIVILDLGKENSVELISVGDIGEEHRGQLIMVRGYVSNMSKNKEHLYFKLSLGGASIEAVLFKADGDALVGRREKVEQSLQKQYPIRVQGTVDLYKGAFQLVVTKVYKDY